MWLVLAVGAMTTSVGALTDLASAHQISAVVAASHQLAIALN